MVRLKDVAARAGVSIMTVSKVMRDASDISAATKARVRQLALQMGYMPDAMAQSLRTRTTKLFGLVVSTVTNPIVARVVMAIEGQAFAMGYDLLVAHSLNLPEREEQVIRKMLSRRVEGLFISPVYRLKPQAPIYEELSKRNTPTVILGQRAPFCEKFTGVEVDDLAASYQVTKHLLELGHRRIAFFAGAQLWPYSQERLEGYRRALRDANVPWDDRLVFLASSTIEGGEKTTLQMLNESPQATAIQAVNDQVAIGAVNVLLNQGLRIPADVSVAGYGNIMASEYFQVPLTTVNHPKMRLGLAATELMQQLLKQERPESKRLGAELVVRSSTGPAPSRKSPAP